MRADACVARPHGDSTVATSGSLFDAETRAPESALSGSYELQALSDKSAHARFGPHDDSTVPSQRSESLTETDDPAMSRTPLLVRSSPAQGTGSYGGLPVLSVSSSPDDSDDHVASFLRRGKKKGKSKLRNSEPSMRRTCIESTNDGSIQSEPAFASSARRRTPRDANSDEPLDEALAGQEEPLLEARFNTGGMGASGITAPRVFESLQSSSTNSPMDGSDDEDSSEPEDLHDSKANGHISDNSPYAQVRAAVGASDDFTLSINTPRMWILSILFAILGSSTNLFFSLRYPSVSITPIIALLLVHPLGLLWDQVLKRPDDPEELFENGVLVSRGNSQPGSTHNTLVFRSSLPRKTRCRLWLAQGRWNLKEHCCVYISSNVSFGFAFATDVIVEQTKFYQQDLGIVYQVLLTLSTQILGYALAGLTRQYLVRPSGMIWPGTLVPATMFTALHKDENKPANGWTISPSKFFVRVLLGAVAFYFLPGLLFPALSYFSVITWFAPKNVVIANLFGISSGLGLFPVTFDWAQIAYIGSPLIIPFWAALNILGGLVVVMWILAPIMYYMNVMYSSYMPILSTIVFDNRGKPYDVSKILTDNFLFDKEAYENYSRVFLPITYVLSYALQFAALTALVTHTAVWHGKDIVKQWRHSWAEIRGRPGAAYEPLQTAENGRDSSERVHRMSTSSEPELENLLTTEDVHNRLMRRYDDVPIFWYLMTGISMGAIGMFVVEYYPIHLPWYGLLLALGIAVTLFVPIGIIMAITNQQSSLYLICQLICGVVFPGRPVANMVFTTYGYISSTQGLKFSSDLKLGHYMKIPPKILFNLQLSATIISSLTQIGVLNWMLAFIPGICTSEAINGFTCPIARVHFNGSILWGVVGPKQFFGPGALYRPLVWAFLLGAVAPILLWFPARRNRKSILRRISFPVVFGSLSWIPPATGLNFSVWAIVCYVFNYHIRNRRKEWWNKYNMTLSAALDSGLAVGVVIIFFVFLFPGWMDGFKWWGTEVYKQGCDWQACSYRTVPEGGHFGPPDW
ncbi:OPT-domain-containing protein [Karstenula rhodostoma CBS 690.94]|uniref:OPT-domain-containing protein n=1 Tax=Karstenula rhodostoma CBS 690.94 TaxID=1392251 RepID=A0A9P4PIZ0_9PLEO|nr:OPT-domain-containing protein [Karstenula rhodostoma CBS 690.94]